MKNTYKTLALLGMALALQACVVAPPIVDGTFNSGPGINDEFGFVEPRVHFGNRSTVRVWLHPNYALPDAYDLALGHCRQFGLWARPYRDWNYQTSTGRFLNYNCIRNRPNISRLHINRRPQVQYPRRGTVAPRRPVVTRPRPGHQRPVFNSPSGRPQPVYSRPQNRRPTVTPTRPSHNEVGKPWQHNPNKGSVNTRPDRPRPSKTEIGKPWTHNTEKETISNRPVKKEYTRPSSSRPSSRPSIGGSSSSSSRPTRQTRSWNSQSTSNSINTPRSRPSYRRSESRPSSRTSNPSSRSRSKSSSSSRRSTLAL